MMDFDKIIMTILSNRTGIFIGKFDTYYKVQVVTSNNITFEQDYDTRDSAIAKAKSFIM